MIKIPKSLDDLKKIVSDAGLSDTLTKVQSSINTAVENSKGAVAEGEMGEIIEQLKKCHEQEIDLLTRLSRLTADFQKQVAAMKQQAQAAAPPEAISEPAAPVAATPAASVQVSAADPEPAVAVAPQPDVAADPVNSST